MSIGTYISVTMHAGMVGLLLLNGNFESNPREISVTEAVSYTHLTLPTNREV